MSIKPLGSSPEQQNSVEEPNRWSPEAQKQADQLHLQQMFEAEITEEDVAAKDELVRFLDRFIPRSRRSAAELDALRAVRMTDIDDARLSYALKRSDGSVDDGWFQEATALAKDGDIVSELGFFSKMGPDGRPLMKTVPVKDVEATTSALRNEQYEQRLAAERVTALDETAVDLGDRALEGSSVEEPFSDPSSNALTPEEHRDLLKSRGENRDSNDAVAESSIENELKKQETDIQAKLGELAGHLTQPDQTSLWSFAISLDREVPTAQSRLSAAVKSSVDIYGYRNLAKQLSAVRSQLRELEGE